MNQIEALEDRFLREYGVRARWIARAPGRVNLIGEHTDYNDGFVLPMAIDRDALIAAAPNGRPFMQLRSTMTDESARLDLSRPIDRGPVGDWTNYLRGVVAGFFERNSQPSGMDLLVHSAVPAGIGLSSSAALEVAMATLLEAVMGCSLDPLDKVLLCQRAEHRYAGVPCGIMDQFVASFARKDELLLLDCRSREAQWIAFSDLEVSVLIVSTNVKHQLSRSEYRRRRAECQEAARALGVTSLRDVAREGELSAYKQLAPVSLKRARHVVTEIARTRWAAKAIQERSWSEVGRLMYASHESLRHDFEVSCPELDILVEIGRSIGEGGGLYGCRMTGGGFGGCAVALIRTDAIEFISRRIRARYGEHFESSPTLFLSRPAGGASLLKG